MGLIPDSNLLIAAERKGDALGQAIHRIREVDGEQQLALSAISIIELTHNVRHFQLIPGLSAVTL